MRTKTLMKKFSDYGISINSMAFSLDGLLLVYGATKGSKGLIGYYNVQKDETIREFAQFDGLVNSVMFNPNNKLLAVGLNVGIVKILDVINKKVIQNIIYGDSAIKSVAFNLQGNILAAGLNNGKIKLWNINYESEFQGFSIEHFIMY
ncbi:MAG: hypothetical protein WA432_03715 [Candidatus Babeliaceae bacterium]